MAQLFMVVMIINYQFVIYLIFCDSVWVSFDHLSSLSINYILRIPQRRAFLPGLSVFLISPRMVAIVTDEKRAVLIIWLVFSLCLRDSEKRFSMFHHSVLFFCLCHTVSSLERLRASAAWHTEDAEDTSPLLERNPAQLVTKSPRTAAFAGPCPEVFVQRNCVSWLSCSHVLVACSNDINMSFMASTWYACIHYIHLNYLSLHTVVYTYYYMSIISHNILIYFNKCLGMLLDTLSWRHSGDFRSRSAGKLMRLARRHTKPLFSGSAAVFPDDNLG